MWIASENIISLLLQTVLFPPNFAMDESLSHRKSDWLRHVFLKKTALGDWETLLWSFLSWNWQNCSKFECQNSASLFCPKFSRWTSLSSNASPTSTPDLNRFFLVPDKHVVDGDENAMTDNELAAMHIPSATTTPRIQSFRSKSPLLSSAAFHGLGPTLDPMGSHRASSGKPDLLMKSTRELASEIIQSVRLEQVNRKLNTSNIQVGISSCCAVFELQLFKATFMLHLCRILGVLVTHSKNITSTKTSFFRRF